MCGGIIRTNIYNGIDHIEVFASSKHLYANKLSSIGDLAVGVFKVARDKLSEKSQELFTLCRGLSHANVTYILLDYFAGTEDWLNVTT